MRFTITILSVLASVCMSTVVVASTVWEATDGDINTFNFNNGAGGFGFGIFDDNNITLNDTLGYLPLQNFDRVTVDNMGTNWSVTNLAGGSLTLTDSGYFRIAVDDGTGWSGDTGYIPYGGGGGYQLEFLGGAANLLVVDVQPVPVPASLYLMFSGLIGMVGFVRRRASLRIKLNIKRNILAMLMMASGSVFAAGSASSNYAIPWDVLDGGGGVASSSGYALSDSVAQGAVGRSSSGGYVMLAGFHSLPDSDVDAIKDFMDNCIDVVNTDQRDTNGDGYGNICDPDLDNSGAVNFADLSIMKSVFFTPDADADLNGDGSVNFGDLSILKAMFFQPPGPSAVAP